MSAKTSPVKFNRIVIGPKITEARKKSGFNSVEKFAAELRTRLDKLPPAIRHEYTGGKRKKLSRQMIEYWEKGKALPPLPMIDLMAQVFRKDFDEAWILFQEKRAEQIQHDKTVLARISAEEIDLVQIFRAADDPGKKAILASAKGIATDHPAPDASLHPLRRTNDQQH